MKFKGSLNVSSWSTAKMCEYKFITTFWNDFTRADKLRAKAIKNTYKITFNKWKNNYKYLIDLVMVLNQKCWEHREKDIKIFKLYSTLFYKTSEYVLDNLKDDELKYYLSVTN